MCFVLGLLMAERVQVEEGVATTGDMGAVEGVEGEVGDVLQPTSSPETGCAPAATPTTSPPASAACRAAATSPTEERGRPPASAAYRAAATSLSEQWGRPSQLAGELCLKEAWGVLLPQMHCVVRMVWVELLFGTRRVGKVVSWHEVLHHACSLGAQCVIT